MVKLDPSIDEDNSTALDDSYDSETFDIGSHLEQVD